MTTTDTRITRISLIMRTDPPGVLALGAWLKNAACRLDGGDATWSNVHGDLGSPAACIALEASARALLRGAPVAAIAHDLHPDFFSTHLALRLAAELGVPAVGVEAGLLVALDHRQ